MRGVRAPGAETPGAADAVLLKARRLDVAAADDARGGRDDLTTGVLDRDRERVASLSRLAAIRHLFDWFPLTAQPTGGHNGRTLNL